MSWLVQQEQYDSVVRAQAASAGYLSSRLRSESYGLRCVSSDGSYCPVDNCGHVFAMFFISEAMGAALSAPERAAMLARIEREQQDGAWGYAVTAPIDADDTAFVLRTSRNLGRAVDTSGLELFFHDRAYTTFEQGPEREVTRLVFDVSLKNNFRVHPEVLANIYGLLAGLGEEARIDETLIRAAQAPQGYFRTYFYPSKYYGTWLVLDCLGKSGRLREARERAVRFLATSQNQDGSWGHPGNAYETALALNAYPREAIHRQQLHTAVRFLLDAQDSDGSWYTPQPLWEFRHQEQPVVTWQAYDSHRVVTTALALKALKRYATQGGGAAAPLIIEP